MKRDLHPVVDGELGEDVGDVGPMVAAWLYRIAHHACVDMHRSPQRRASPMDLGPSTDIADIVSLGDPGDEQWWVDPIADERVIDPFGDPAVVVAARDSIRLAFVVALQRLPPRQHAAITAQHNFVTLERFAEFGLPLVLEDPVET